MKHMLVMIVALFSLPAFSSVEVLHKSCSTSYKVRIEDRYNNRILRYDKAVEVQIFKNNDNFQANYFLSEKEENSEQVDTVGTSEIFKTSDDLVRDNLDNEGLKLNPTESIILEIKILLREWRNSYLGSDLEGLRLEEIKSAIVYPIAKYGMHEINILEAKDAKGKDLGSIIFIDGTFRICK